MIVFFQLLFAALIAVFVGSFFYYVFKFTGPWGSFWTFILVLIMAGVAASVWLEPFGPMVYNLAWAPVLFFILLFALLLAAVTPSRYRTRNPAREDLNDISTRDVPVLAVSAVFWVFLAALMIATLIGIFR